MKLVNQFLVLVFFCFSVSLAQTDEFFVSQTTFGGYGELHYNYSDNGKTKNKILDFHRFVLFVGHSWTEKWSFKSEIEIEHNLVEEGQGELVLEQAYINYHYSDLFGFEIGVVQPSVGLINEFHEPPMFLGVERPEYNVKIIPTTWSGNGIGFYGRYSGFDYKLVIMEGLDGDKISETSGIRDARQNGFKADASNLLYNFRLDYTGTPGLKIGASYSYNNAKGKNSENGISLVEFHALYSRNNLFAAYEFGNIDFEKGNLQASRGFYFDLGYNISDMLGLDVKIIPFIRWIDYNTAAKTLSGGDSERQNHFKYWMAGLSVKPIDQIVIKLDYGVRTKVFGNEDTRLFNFGAGYMF